MHDPDFQRRLRETFQAEASEHLRALSQDAFALETAAAAAHPPIIERVFRQMHTLKGAARMVGELEAEALCQTLEQQLSRLKHAGGAAPLDFIVELHARIAELATLLNVALALRPTVGEPLAPAPAAPAESPAPSAAAVPPPPAGMAHVRVPAARLDALLLRAEEMAGARLTGDQRVTDLRELATRTADWAKDWQRARAHVAAVRRFADERAPAGVAAELKALLQYLDRNHELTHAWQRDLARLAQTTAAEQRRLGSMIEELLDDTKEVLMQPVASLLELFPAFVREIAQQQGKEIDLHVTGGETEIDRRVIEELKDALLHLVRNAVDHGIETPAERRAQGKSERGRVAVAVAEKSGGVVEIAVSDDGRGIDSAEVTANARRLGVLPADAPELSDDDAMALLFTSGFSTRAAATELSGHGLGLAIVREKAEQIGGAVAVESAPQRGTSFRFLLPITLARFRGVFVVAQQQQFVVPSPYVRRVVRVRESQLRRLKNQETIEHDGATLVVIPLASLLGLPRTKPPVAAGATDPVVFIVVTEFGRARIGLQVDAVPHEQDVVMKSLGPLLRGAHAYVGATLAGGGAVVPVLNVVTLVTQAARRSGGGRDEAPRPEKPGVRRKRSILVAEDSITSRSLLKNILQTAGYDVRTAVDGADALTTLKFEPVDLVISDVQMPRMDGFELTTRIRADAALATLPVILITSLASREDKARGVDAGASAYIVKSQFDQSDLLQAIGRLIP